MLFRSDPARGCEKCVSVDIEDFWGITATHTLVVTFGSRGKINWRVRDAQGGLLLAYAANGESKGKTYFMKPRTQSDDAGDMGAQGSIKFGLYRLAKEVSSAKAFVGDYSAEES